MSEVATTDNQTGAPAGGRQPYRSLATTDGQAAILRDLDREATKLEALVSKVRNQISKLAEYRAALISAAVTGKIDVRGEVEA